MDAQLSSSICQAYLLCSQAVNELQLKAQEAQPFAHGSDASKVSDAGRLSLCQLHDVSARSGPWCIGRSALPRSTRQLLLTSCAHATCACP